PEEQGWQLVRRDAGAGVLHGELDAIMVHVADGDDDLTIERELESVGNEIENDRFPHFAIDKDRLRQPRTSDDEAQPGGLAQRAEIARKLTGELGKVGRLEAGLRAAGLDAREIEQAVHQLEQA